MIKINTQVDEQWTTIIRPQREGLSCNLWELWHYRDLILLFIRRNYIVQYKQTVLGPFWFLIQPLVTTLIFMGVFGEVAKIPTDGLPSSLFYMAGITFWNYFAGTINGTSSTFVSNANIFGKVYFPRLVVPIATVITNICTFLIQFCALVFCLLFHIQAGAEVSIGWHALLIPLLVIQLALLGMGVGLWVSSLTTKYRDLAFLATFGVQLWMFLTPVVYPLSLVPEKWRWLVVLNPMTPIVETFRYALVGRGMINSLHLGLSLAVTFMVLFGGVLVFNRIERTFVDTV